MKNIILISAAIVTIIGGGISVYMMGKSSSNEPTSNAVEITITNAISGLPQNEQPDNAFNQALNTIRLAANGVLETLNTLPEKPDHVKIDFAIKIDADAQAMLAKSGSSDAQLKVSLAWRTPPAKDKSKTKEE